MATLFRVVNLVLVVLLLRLLVSAGVSVEGVVDDGVVIGAGAARLSSGGARR